jgi:hypothetical protein
MRSTNKKTAARLHLQTSKHQSGAKSKKIGA